MARKVVGLDIGTTAVRAAQVSVRCGQVVLERIGQAGLPGGAVVDGEVKDPAAVATAIKDLWRRTRISSRRVIIGVANQRMVVRLVDLPWMEPSELRSSLAFQAGDYLPSRSIRPSSTTPPSASSRPPAGSGCCGCCWSPPRGDARRPPGGGARGRAPARGHRPQPDGVAALARPVSGFEEGAEALIDVGARVTNLVVHDNGVLRFVRILLLGGEDVTETPYRVSQWAEIQNPSGLPA